MKLKSITSEPSSLASPPPKTVPPIFISPLIKVLSVTTLEPIFKVVIPYKTEVLAPP